jgi:uncharacterized membrane protein
MMGLTITLLVFCCAPFVHIAFKAGQSGHKLRVPEDALDAPFQGPTFAVHPERGDDRYWKWGLFYCNRDDPAILVEDRFGINSGLNYARPAIKIAAGALAALVVAFYAIVTMMFFRSFPWTCFPLPDAIYCACSQQARRRKE